MAYHPPVSADDVALLDPTQLAPAVVEQDGPATAVGHGRVLPLVGSRFADATTANQRSQRPHILDVSLAGGQRIYADTESDVIAVLIGDGFGDLVDELKSLEDSDGDRQLNLLRQVLGRRHQHADRIRIELQRRVNAEAQSDGRWAQLTDEERNELERCTDPNPETPAPSGLPTELPAIDDDGEISPMIIGIWTADVPLVCNSADYEPIGQTLRPLGMQPQEGPEGLSVIPVESEPNIIWLDVLEDITYLQSLDKAGYLTTTVRPVDQPDALWHDTTV